MINSLSNQLVSFLEKNQCLKEDKNIYIHGARIFISSMIGTLIVIFIGFLTNHLLEAILYEILISSSRSIMGGYHCKSYLNCIFLYVAIFIVGLLFVNYYYIKMTVLILIESIGLIVTILNNPVDNINKKVTLKKKQTFKKYSIIYIVLYIIFMNLMIYFHINCSNMIVYIFINIHLLTIGGRFDYELCQK